MSYGDFKDLTKRIASDKFLLDKVFNFTKNADYDRDQSGIPSVVYKCFDKKSLGGAKKSQIFLNQHLAEELRKPVIIKFEQRKVYPSFKDNICGADLSDMQYNNNNNNNK